MYELTLREKQLLKITLEHRRQLEKSFGTGENLAGKCIISSDRLRFELDKAGFRVEPLQVWVLYEDFESCTDCCYEGHWLNKVTIGRKLFYIDCTIDQFQWAFQTHKLPKVYIGRTLPNWMLRKMPGIKTLSKCGWTDWYNTGNYINEFDYWSYLKVDKNIELWASIRQLIRK